MTGIEADRKGHLFMGVFFFIMGLIAICYNKGSGNDHWVVGGILMLVGVIVYWTNARAEIV